MGLIDRLLHRKTSIPTESIDDVRNCMRSLANSELADAIRFLLVNGYEKDPAISVAGPVGRGPAHVALFCALVRSWVFDFVCARKVWRGHESAAILISNEVISEWGYSHGADARLIEDRYRIVREGAAALSELSKSRSSDGSKAVAAWKKLHAWFETHPELEITFGEFLVISSDDALVTTYLEKPAFVFNHVENHPLLTVRS